MINTAIANNIHLCTAVLEQFGIGAETQPHATLFHGVQRPYFPSVITHSPDIDGRTRAHIMALPKGAGVKDSFASLDLSQYGFEPMVNAHWIARTSTAATQRALYRVRADTLPAWCRAWAPDTPKAWANFTPDLLERTDLAIYATPDFHAGVITNTHMGGVTGFSNLFGDPKRLLAALTDVPDSDSLVGYETDTGPYLDLGFTELGPLTVWIKTG